LKALACLALLALAGCSASIRGDWHMVKSLPNRETFAIDDVTFDKSGGFEATFTLEGRTSRDTGTYEFNGFKLTFRPTAGGQRQYNAVLKVNTLEVIDGKRQVILQKGRRGG
jgi:hypothetical protein